MNTKELRRGEVLSRVKRGELKLTEAAELLDISYRQAKRLKKRYGEGGSQALVHGNVGRASNRADSKRREQVLKLVRDNYSGEPQERFGPTLASEHLAADHGLEVPRETLRRWMLAAGLWSRRRKRKPHRSRRQRKAHFGELIQLDGSHHDWLEGRGPKGCMMNFVDDATGRALCRFSDEETTWAAADLLQAWVRQYGIPKALYCDWKNVYKRQPTSREALEGIEPETQFGRMCAKLDIGIIAASSPQAKGRVERHHGTHQDRLIKKMRLEGIADYEAANCYVDEKYLDEHNAKFVFEPSAGADFHRRLGRGVSALLRGGLRGAGPRGPGLYLEGRGKGKLPEIFVVAATAYSASPSPLPPSPLEHFDPLRKEILALQTTLFHPDRFQAHSWIGKCSCRARRTFTGAQRGTAASLLLRKLFEDLHGDQVAEFGVAFNQPLDV